MHGAKCLVSNFGSKWAQKLLAMHEFIVVQSVVQSGSVDTLIRTIKIRLNQENSSMFFKTFVWTAIY